MEGECGRVVLGEGGRHHIINFKFFCPRTDLNFELTVDGDNFTIPSLPPVLLLILNVQSYFLCMIINHIQNPIRMIASRSSLYH